MKALNDIKFPALSEVKRSMQERNAEDINQMRLNQNFRILMEELTSIKAQLESIEKVVNEHVRQHASQ